MNNQKTVKLELTKKQADLIQIALEDQLANLEYGCFRNLPQAPEGIEDYGAVIDVVSMAIHGAPFARVLGQWSILARKVHRYQLSLYSITGDLTVTYEDLALLMEAVEINIEQCRERMKNQKNRVQQKNEEITISKLTYIATQIAELAEDIAKMAENRLAATGYSEEAARAMARQMYVEQTEAWTNAYGRALNEETEKPE